MFEDLISQVKEYKDAEYHKGYEPVEYLHYFKEAIETMQYYFDNDKELVDRYLNKIIEINGTNAAPIIKAIAIMKSFFGILDYNRISQSDWDWKNENIETMFE